MQDSSDKPAERGLAAVRDRNVLRSRLDEIVRRKKLKHASIGVLVDGQQLVLASNEAVERAANPVAAGCLAKLLTGSLVGDAVAGGASPRGANPRRQGAANSWRQEAGHRRRGAVVDP